MARIPEDAWKELDKLFAENPAPDRREVKVILRKYVKQADPDVLAERELSRKAQYCAAKYRDADGQRDILADRETNQYVVIENCGDLKTLDRIRGDLHTKIAGYRKSVRKVAARRAFLTLFKTPYVPKRRGS